MSTVILSCTTLLEYVRQAQTVCGTSFPVIELDRRYHIDPDKMRDHIIKTLSDLPAGVDTVLVAMGFCGGSWQNVSCSQTLVIPKVADCVALTLVTPEHFASDLKEPGHMYLFGDGNNGFSINGIYSSLLEKYSKEEADLVFNMYFEHYYHLDIIDNGLYDCYDPGYVARAQEDAERIHSELDFVPGSNVLLELLISGKWDDRFFIVSPGTVITQSAFFDC